MKINSFNVSKLVIVCTLLLLTSCFDIIDEINLNKDGSGELILTLNMSKSKTKIASMLLLDSINGHKVPTKEDIENTLEKAVTHLQGAEGISNVSKTVDFDNYIFSLGCHFKTVGSINKVIRDIMKEQKIDPLLALYTFDKNKNIFSKNYTLSSDAKVHYDKLKGEDKEVFNGASYTSIYRFENEVINYSNTNAKVSKSKKAVMLRASALDLINGKTNLTNQIQLKN